MIKIEQKDHVNGIKEYFVETNNLKVSFLNVGASIFKLETPDKNGNFEQISLRLANEQEYLDNNPTYVGVTVARMANRIAQARFVLDGKEYILSKNDGDNNNHSSGTGASSRIWDSHIDGDKIIFSILLKEEHDGFPGNINISAIYQIKEDGFKVTYEAVSSKDTICNITNHSYFNLSGNLKRDVYMHEFENTFIGILEPRFDGKPNEVLDPKEILSSKVIGEFVKNNPSIFGKKNGVTQSVILDKRKKVIIRDPISAREMVITTSYPTAVLYTQNVGISQLDLNPHMGIAIEAQYLPNDINVNRQNSETILRPGDLYKHFIKYTFNIKQ